MSGRYDSMEDECKEVEAERKMFSTSSKISHRKAKIASAWAFVVSSFEVIKKMMPRGAMLEGVGMHPASMAGFGCCVYPSHGRVDR